MNIVNFVNANWGVIATALLAISEVLTLIPSIKSNGIFELIVRLLNKITK